MRAAGSWLQRFSGGPQFAFLVYRLQHYCPSLVSPQKGFLWFVGQSSGCSGRSRVSYLRCIILAWH